MDPGVFRSPLRLSAALLLVGQLLYIAVTLAHPGGEANDHSAVFAEYAGSGVWKVVHVAQFGAMAIFVVGLIALIFALGARGGIGMWASRFGAVAAVAALGLYGVLQAVDGVALKQAVDTWATAPAAEKAARFASAETIRWLEWGVRSYHDFALGLALLLFAVAVAGTPRIPRPVAVLMALSGLTYLVQGWVVGAEGFLGTGTIAIVLAYLVNLVWMVWLVVVAWRMPDSEPRPVAD